MQAEEDAWFEREVLAAKAKPFIIVGIPAYNEEKTIAKVVLRAKKCVDWVIVCDDGSTDMTADIAERVGADVVKHERNLGYGTSLQSLFQKAQEFGADVLVTLDADGQHDPSEIPLLVEPVVAGRADIVVGSRFRDGAKNIVPRYRRLGIKAITELADVASSLGLSDAQCGFRVYGRKALECIRLVENGMGASVEVLMEAKKQGLNILEVPTCCTYRGLERTSTQGSLRHGTSVVMSILRLVVEDKPLYFLGVPGVLSLLVGVFFGVWMLQIYAVTRSITTNIALASIAFTLIGFFAVSTSITLYAISRLVLRSNGRR